MSYHEYAAAPGGISVRHYNGHMLMSETDQIWEIAPDSIKAEYARLRIEIMNYIGGDYYGWVGQALRGLTIPQQVEVMQAKVVELSHTCNQDSTVSEAAA